MIVHFNDFKKEYASLKKEIDSAMQEVAASGWYILGEKVKKFEEDFAKYQGSKYAVGVGNGLDALQISLMTLSLPKNSEVITTSISAAATALAIERAGCKPIFIDVDQFLHLDAEGIEKTVTKKTRVIIPVHLYGNPSEMDKIMRIAKKHNLFVVEDCAQAHGATYKNKRVGTFGQFGCFSFYPTKNLGALGDGGIIITDNEELAKKCKVLRNYGQVNRYEHEVSGINSRLDEMQAAILSVKLKKLDLYNKKRRQAAEIYKKELNKIKEINIVGERNGSESSWHLFVIKAKERDKLQQFLKEKGIDTLIHYPIPLHKQNCFKEHSNLRLPQAEDGSQNIVSLPIHPFLTKREVEYVCKNIKDFYL